jgi:hypothetical protein
MSKQIVEIVFEHNGIFVETLGQRVSYEEYLGSLSSKKDKEYAGIFVFNAINAAERECGYVSMPDIALPSICA